MPISGVPHLAHFLLRSAKFHQTHLVGRLTLLEKLIQMHRAASSGPQGMDSNRRICYRHLCSSLIFARRHVYPPEQPVFPHNYVSEVEARRWVGYHRRTDVVLMTPTVMEAAGAGHPPFPDSQTPSPMALQEVKFSSSGSLMEANLKASRLARRVFIAVCRALLAEPDAQPATGSQLLPCAEDFVNSELSCLDASLAGRFRSKLADVLRPPAPQYHHHHQQPQQQRLTFNQPSANVLSQHTQVLPTPPTVRLLSTATITPSSITAPEAIPPSGGYELSGYKQRPSRLQRLRSADGVGDSACCPPERKTSAPFFCSEEVPPMPPPRRLSQPAKQGRVELPPFAAASRNNPPPPPPPPPPPAPPPPLSPLTHIFPSSVNVRVAPEPAYDPVAISETGPYSSSESEEEEEDSECADHKKTEESLEKLDWKTGHLRESSTSRGLRGLDCPGEYIYQEPPQTTSEELAVLRKAVRRSGRLPTPLVSIPSLPVSMDPAVLNGDPMKATCSYKEGVDWLLGPFLGRGAFSQCFQARDIRTGTLMAVKRLRLGKGSAFPMHEIGEGHPAMRAAVRPVFRRNGRRPTDLSPESGEQLAAVQAEVAIMQRINHPNVLRFYGITFNPLKKQVDVFVEWMPGGSITSLLDQYGAFTEPVALAFILQVVRGLSCLHRHRILHRDLKGTFFRHFYAFSIIRISDFGASARLESQGSVSGQFQGQVIGTFAFMAPEFIKPPAIVIKSIKVLRGEAYGRACDIWSVGCCLLEMLTGKPPWNDSRLTNQYALMFTVSNRLMLNQLGTNCLLPESPGSSRSPPQCLSKSVSLPLSAINEGRSSSRAPRALPPVPDSPTAVPPVPELCSTYDKLIISFPHKTPVTTSVGGTSSSKLSRRGC
ncbi:unnamed protein product [Schistocephalus solidus]|uniref:Protein kinase domain-containing protein n=1 Tax=Schistocephalus solidus TaxID=70667 RepID=A0A183SQN0_SCHSO|nr:unnamed protein product [Schistocephalus solidus]